jgi:threonylcarbamoyladenosine tRNA methylthiotransferase MtaB
MNFSGMHVFRYSKRPGTAAARMHGHIAESVKKERSARLLALAEENERRFAEQSLGQIRSVLWEHIAGASEDGFINVGYTDNYIRVCCTRRRVLTDHITPARLLRYDSNGVQVLPVLD